MVYGIILTLQARYWGVKRDLIDKRKSRAKALLENPHLNP